MKVNSNITLKILSAVLFLFVAAAAILIARNPATGYELSIYAAMPPLFWILLITAFGGGIGIVVYHISKRKEGNWWQIGLLLILLSNLVIVLLPYLRGYAFSCSGDHLSHLGYVKDILNTGEFSGDVYPITHILIAQACSILNIPPEAMMNFAGPFFYLMFVLFTYVLSRELLPRPAAILASVASTVLFCYYYNQVFPMGFAFITFPLIFYLYFKYSRGKSVSLATLLIVLVVLMAFFHPVASFMLIAALVVMELAKPLVNRYYPGKINPARSFLPQPEQISLSLPLIAFIVLMLWIWENYAVWNSAVTSVASWFSAELFVKPMTEIALESFSKLGLSPLGQLELFVKMYGHYFIFALLSFIVIIMLGMRRLNLSPLNQRNIGLYADFFLLVAFVCLIDFVSPLTTLSSGRIMHLLPALFPPLIGIALYQTGKTRDNGREAPSESGRCLQKGKAWRSMVVALIIMVCSLIGIFAIHPSPNTLRPYWGVSHAEETGGYCLVEHGNPDTSVVGIATAPTYRYADALGGDQITDYPRENKDEHVPDHFNYAQYSTLGKSFTGDRYMLTREEVVEMLYTELWPQIGKFNRDDFAKLRDDPSVDKLYDNGEMQTWYVHGQSHVT